MDNINDSFLKKLFNEMPNENTSDNFSYLVLNKINAPSSCISTALRKQLIFGYILLAIFVCFLIVYLLALLPIDNVFKISTLSTIVNYSVVYLIKFSNILHQFFLFYYKVSIVLLFQSIILSFYIIRKSFKTA